GAAERLAIVRPGPAAKGDLLIGMSYNCRPNPISICVENPCPKKSMFGNGGRWVEVPPGESRAPDEARNAGY
ncbi:MAG TPA: hypothetical protein PJ982_20355, partial [Lacipirellulaceae bacterium]|nr:hypothetical protein [Lacipirellulaceae bacterium]